MKLSKLERHEIFRSIIRDGIFSLCPLYRSWWTTGYVRELLVGSGGPEIMREAFRLRVGVDGNHSSRNVAVTGYFWKGASRQERRVVSRMVAEELHRMAEKGQVEREARGDGPGYCWCLPTQAQLEGGRS